MFAVRPAAYTFFGCRVADFPLRTIVGTVTGNQEHVIGFERLEPLRANPVVCMRRLPGTYLA
ncbi:hypothetical protein [Mesorhizobium sp. BR-1-1-10]|uniref:hypothetical protein n=1 Tax=Mesorhizobium sp. BR-1-1-10 TaxID=2876660 RepID=UPI001CD14C54|nr:hypothetical protein [Mesorhizobium sp. BR-1-1-10]MBZ9974412.1 hypothetical protein [Mesorhizobium sp. BR-1-1-10]